MLNDYTNQDITYKQKISANDANEATYATSTTIRGRFVYKRTLIRTATGEQVMSNAYINTITNMSEGDVITHDSKDWKVRNVYPWRENDGSVSGYTVRL